MRRQPDLATLLYRLARVADEDDIELAGVLRARIEEAAGLFGVDPSAIINACEMQDGKLAAKILGSLAQVRRRALEEQALSMRELAQAAASRLASSATMVEGRVQVEPTVLLGRLLADPGAKMVVFLLPADTHVAVLRSSLAGSSKALRSRDDISAFIDKQGVHLRWRQGLGGLNWLAQPLPAQERASALVVDLSQVRQVRNPRQQRWNWDAILDVATC